jgi:septal ring factor EnvC (AmiA/AmiB activator)
VFLRGLGILTLVMVFVGIQSQAVGQELDEGLSREEIEQEMKRREEELRRVRKDLDEKRRKAQELAGREQDLLKEIERINEEVRVNQDLLVKLGQKKAVLVKDIEMTHRELAIAEASLANATDLLNKRIVGIYKFGRGQVMEIILLSKTFADLAKRIYYLSMIANHDRELMSVFEERVETRRVLADHIQGRKAKIEAVEGEVKQETRNLQLKREERDALVRRLKDKRYYYENLARRLEGASRNLETFLGELEARREEASYAGTPFEGRLGRLLWPCEGEVVSSFGVETHPRFGTIIRNNGIDIKALPGTKIRAVASGVVSFAGTLSGFGNCIILSHGQGFYTLYGHLESFMVDTGYEVREGDAIGFVGDTSVPEGPVLHFEIRHGKKPLDPGPWLLK